MRILGVESTCDETAAAVVEEGKIIRSNIVASQTDLHAVYGGVVPELACRRHGDVLFGLIDQALMEAKTSLEAIDLIAVAHTPGLIGALLIGLQGVKALAFSSGKPFIGVNHIEAHLYAALMSQEIPLSFPTLGVVLSGGHTALFLVHSLGNYQLLGQTRDDALGEAFDKTAKILGLPYPGGPLVEQLAKEGDPTRYPLRPGQIKDHPLDFSFSGIKTAVLYTVTPPHRPPPHLTPQDKKDIAASFQEAVFADVIAKTTLAAKQTGCRSVLFGGGVTNSRTLRTRFAEQAPHLNLYWPPANLSLDNAAMIAGLAHPKFLKHPKSAPWTLEAKPTSTL